MCTVKPILFIGKGGHVKIYPAPEEAYTHESWEILVDIEDEVNSWGVRHDLIDPCCWYFGLSAVVSSRTQRLGSQSTT